MFERFTDRARRVVVLAQEEARLLNHNYIGTEHLLLGLLHEGEGAAFQALESLDVPLEEVRTRVEAIIGKGSGSPSGHIPFTPRAKKVLEMALREALQLGHNFIGTEHILLGIIREAEGVAAQVLVELGADLQRVRRRVVRLIAADEVEGLGSESPEAPGRPGRELLVESLMGEVRRLRRDVDALREALRRLEPDPDREGPPQPGPFPSSLRCSFCSESQDVVAKLVAGPGVHICDRCIALCQEILDEEIGPPDPESSTGDPPSDS